MSCMRVVVDGGVVPGVVGDTEVMGWELEG